MGRMTWKELEALLMRMAMRLRTDSDGAVIPKLPPPISEEVAERGQAWLIEWLADTDRPRPGGEVQAAAFARVYCAAISAANAAHIGMEPLPKLPTSQLLEFLLVVMWPQQAHLWDAHWELAYGE
jgi:hypothetical protein